MISTNSLPVDTTCSPQSETNSKQKALIIGLAVGLSAAVLALIGLLIWIKKPNNVISSAPYPMNPRIGPEQPTGYPEFIRCQCSKTDCPRSIPFLSVSFEQTFVISHESVILNKQTESKIALFFSIIDSSRCDREAHRWSEDVKRLITLKAAKEKIPEHWWLSRLERRLLSHRVAHERKYDLHCCFVRWVSFLVTDVDSISLLPVTECLLHVDLQRIYECNFDGSTPLQNCFDPPMTVVESVGKAFPSVPTAPLSDVTSICERWGQLECEGLIRWFSATNGEWRSLSIAVPSVNLHLADVFLQWRLLSDRQQSEQ